MKVTFEKPKKGYDKPLRFPLLMVSKSDPSLIVIMTKPLGDSETWGPLASGLSLSRDRELEGRWVLEEFDIYHGKATISNDL